MNNPLSEDELLEFFHQLADQSRIIIQKYFRQDLNIETKLDNSPVTIADKSVEHKLRGMINTKYPDHAVLGEEEGSIGSSKWQWIIDPIDGTKSFLSGFPVFCTLIAVFYEGNPVINMIDMPILNERFYATRTQNSKLNKETIKTRGTSTLQQALAFSTDPAMFNSEQQKKIDAIKKAVRQYRLTGDGYLYAMLSAGWIDLVIEADMKPYDFLPLILIVEQAGGIISDWQGNKLTLQSKGEVLASANSTLHQLALNILK